MRKLYYLFFLFFSQSIFAQSPSIQWQKCLGGSQLDYAQSIHQTPDGGYIMGGYTDSQDGDVTGYHGGNGPDAWIVKLDPIGNIIWERTYGGTQGENLWAIRSTSDGGYVAICSSQSIDGDVTGHHGGTVGNYDFWVLKIDSVGNLLWENSYGGTGMEWGNSIEQTADHGYIIVGYSYSSDGNVPYNHGYNDDLIVKLDSTGTLQWVRDIGCSSSDQIASVKQKANGNYLCAASSGLADFDVSTNYGQFDMWVFEMDPSGTILWNKNYGGSLNDFATSMKLTPDGGFVVTGYSKSSDHDVTGVHGIANDYWIIKCDSVGTLQWEKAYGGTFNGDFSYDVALTHDGGYLIAGKVGSTDGDVTNFHGGVYDCWILKLNSSGDLIWQKTLGGNYDESAYSIEETSDFGAIIAGNTTSTNGDVSGLHSMSEADAWVVKLGAELNSVSEFNSDASDVLVFPNPALSSVLISSTEPIRQLRLMNCLGATVQIQNALSEQVNLDLSKQEPGVYFLEVQTLKGKVLRKVVKQ